MKWPLLLAGSALLSATTFRLVNKPSNYGIPQVEGELREKKKLAFRCAPAFIPDGNDPIPVLPGWGNYQWKITTRSDSAQFYFNQGMAMYYSFHIIESRASFDKATRFDPDCAMAWWGKALAYGPNINDFGYQRPSQAYSSAQEALRLRKSVTPVENALIEAVGIRYASDSSVEQAALNGRYRQRMAEVSRRFPGHADVQALYADAQMLLHPWDLYTHDFTPRPWTPSIIATLRQALKGDPLHIGAHHYYIHLLEASNHPQDALKSADFLSTAMPGVAHMVHMPSHIYIRTGYYDKGILRNNEAVQGFQQYLSLYGPVAEGLPLYRLHNLHMKVACAQMAGSSAQARLAAQDLQNSIPKEFLGLGGALGNYIQYMHQAPVFAMIRFGQWQDLLEMPVNDSLAYTSLLQHFGRGMALSRTGQADQALIELKKLSGQLDKEELKEPYTPFSSAYEAGQVARHILAGAIAEAQGDLPRAIQWYESAVRAEDRLVYNEPRDWMLPARHYLGNALLEARRREEAIRVLQKDLTINPSNGWALTGLKTAFERNRQTREAAGAAQRLKSAWMLRDLPIASPAF